MPIRDTLDMWIAQLDTSVAHITAERMRMIAERTDLQALRGRMIANAMTEADAELLSRQVRERLG